MMRFLVALGLMACGAESPPPPCVSSAEVCDRIDNDCDGAIDEGLGSRWYPDDDLDGFGDSRIPLLACDPPIGWVEGPGDCDDTNAQVFPGAPERCNEVDDDCNGSVDDQPVDPEPLFVDLDEDGHGDPSTETVACITDPGLVSLGDDCDDSDPNVLGPIAQWADEDGDGFGAAPEVLLCPEAPGHVPNDLDCDDTDSSVNPLADELPADDRDSDCDGFEQCYTDVDLDGFGSAVLIPSSELSCIAAGTASNDGDCDDTTESISPSQVEICDNGDDDDCDSATPDLFDNDGDGFTCDEDCDDNATPSATVRFADVAVSVGIDVRQGQLPFPCGAELMGGAAAVADYDGDGDLDIFLPRMYLPDLLFENDGTGSFTEVSQARNIVHEGSSNGAVWFDADGDSDLDLFVTSLGLEEGNRLYLNLGSSFLEQSVARGVDFTPTLGSCTLNFSVSVADVDGDGDLDVHQTAWEPDLSSGNDRSRLWLNDGAGSFTESTALDLMGLASFASVWADFDDDGDLDAAVASDWGRSTLWRNDGALAFTEVSASASVGTEENGMGTAVADVDGDGDLDWFVSSIWDEEDPCPAGWGCSGNRLYLGLGDLTFFDATDRGVRDGGWSWGAVFFDYDNDGDLDLGVENGFPNGGFTDDHTRLWENDGTTFFTDRACETGLSRDGQGRSLIPFDMDRDGDLDVLMIHNNEAVRLFESTGATAPWLTVTVSQPGRSNRFGIGATVWMRAAPGDPEVRRDIHLNTQFGSTSPAEAHFGLGDHLGVIDQVRVVWPDGSEDLVTNVVANQVLGITRIVP